MEDNGIHQAPQIATRVAKYLCILLAPIAFTVGSIHLAERLLPGVVRTTYWQNASSAMFLLAGAVVLLLQYRSKLNIGSKILISVPICGFCLWLALMLQFRSNCGDETEFIGATNNGQQSASACR
jgi:hypothetical protein